MLTESTDMLEVKFAGCKYSISDEGVDEEGKKIPNKTEFISGHGISAKVWNATGKKRAEMTQEDRDAISKYKAGDNILIKEYCFDSLNVKKRIDKIASAVEKAVDDGKAKFIEEVGIDEYNRLYNALQNKTEEKEEKKNEETAA